MPEAPLILCVDDNEGARYAMKRTLERAGFRIVEAGTGGEALQRLGERPDLVVLDVHLPDLSGYEVCQRIKGDPRTATTPVLQVSADFIDVEHRTRGLELGADAYLAHPIEPPELIATIRSLLRARRAEEQTRSMARELQSTFNAISDAMCLLDEEGRVIRCNPAMERLAGVEEKTLIGRSHDSILPAMASGAEADPFRRMVKSRAREVQTVQRRDRWLRVTCDPLFDEAGAVSGAVCILSDFTERQRSQEEREELLAREQAARASLEEGDRRKDEFLAMLAHELRNPLAAVTIGMHLLEEVGPESEKASRTRATILRQVGILTRLVDDLLDVSRITRGKVELRKEPLDAREALQLAVTTSKAAVVERRHDLSVDLGNEPVWVLADATRIEQVFANLINNAAKYTEPGGSIALSLRAEAGEAVITVRDNGIGIDPPMLDQVFELFAQADQSPARSRGGLGVGLTLVKRLAEMHGGTVRARSEGLGKGSEFELRLPLLPGAPERAEGQRVAAAPAPRRILLIEDNPDLGETLRDLLQLLGHRVELAPDGVSGVTAALAQRPEVVLVDIGLPGIDGYEVARRLRSQSGRDMLLVALTGYGRPEDRDRALAAGFDAHLVKPADPGELTRLLGELSDRRALAAAGQA